MSMRNIGYLDRTIEPFKAFAKTRAAKLLAGLWLLAGPIGTPIVYFLIDGVATETWFMIWMFGPMGALEVLGMIFLGFLLVRDAIIGTKSQR